MYTHWVEADTPAVKAATEAIHASIHLFPLEGRCSSELGAKVLCWALENCIRTHTRLFSQRTAWHQLCYGSIFPERDLLLGPFALSVVTTKGLRAPFVAFAYRVDYNLGPRLR